MIKDCPFNTCAKYSEKTCISYPLICTRTYTYEGRSVIEWRAIALAVFIQACYHRMCKTLYELSHANTLAASVLCYPFANNSFATSC